jgi:hypothetical protein
LYSIESDIPKNELMTIPVIASVIIVFIKKIKNNFLLMVNDNNFIISIIKNRLAAEHKH